MRTIRPPEEVVFCILMDRNTEIRKPFRESIVSVYASMAGIVMLGLAFLGEFA